MYTEPVENEDEFDGRGEFILGGALIAFATTTYVLMTFFPEALAALLAFDPGGGIAGMVLDAILLNFEIIVSVGTPLLRLIAVLGVVIVMYGLLLRNGTRVRLGPKTEHDHDRPDRNRRGR